MINSCAKRKADNMKDNSLYNESGDNTNNQQNNDDHKCTKADSRLTVKKRCVNPFFSRIDLQPHDYLWLIFGSIFLAPIRIVLSILIFMIGSLLAKFYNFILTTFFDKEHDPDLYHSWREYFKQHLIFVLNCIFFVCGFFKTTIIQKGDPTKEDDAPIYVFAPHTSLFDVAAGLAFNAPSSVAKADIIDIPFFGNIFKFSNPVLVDRASRDSRQDVFKKVADTIKYSKIVFWPEGTCSNHKVLMQFKNGAFKFGYPVLPVAIRFHQFGTPDTLSWTWNGPGTFASLWYTLSRWRTDCEIVKLPVYYPSEDEKSDPDLYAENVSKVFTDELKIPCLNYTFDDAKFMKYHYFHSTCCVKFFKLIDKIRTTRDSKTNSDKKISKSAQDKAFQVFLINILDKIKTNCDGRSVDEELSPEGVVKILGCDDLPEIKDSATLKDFYRCLSQVPEKKPTVFHLRIIGFLTDISVSDLWERLENVHEYVFIHKKDMRQAMLAILYLALNVEHDPDDVCIVNSVKIDNFDSFKQFLLQHYDFALRENANSISLMADKR